ncbi:aminotransferase class I/II-fold pyridoxal phosphate-dependent enzyme [Anoxynatronum sibiricum]|uniref:Aminotransferase class I/II-fold pyridoxal phosphate-dependent enzyme n=1 Tax=Anoxynatronum sibiricum TaxID=210623 RepID=A0ABU9VW48_9CLOT
MSVSVVAPHSKRPAEEDKVFAANRKAQEAAKKVGADQVINSTIGALLEDDGSLSIMQTAMETFKNLPDAEIAAYAPIAGLPEFLEAAKTAVFRDYRPKGHIRGVATPGGTGGIRHAVWNYMEPGETLLTSDWFWAPYRTIAEEHGRKMTTFTLFDEKKAFNLASFKEKVQELADHQERVLVVLNTPAHNPTGYSLTDEEWQEVLTFLSNVVDHQSKKVILYVDIAYIDFAGDMKTSRGFMKQFENLPQNLLVLIGYSMSKAFTFYGLRSGALLCVSSSEEVADEFESTAAFSNRAVWSNGTRGAQRVLAKVYSDPALLEKVEAERAGFSKLMFDRARAFVDEAADVGLNIFPYRAGFFITIPCENPAKVSEELTKDHLFLLPMAKGLRFAACAVSVEKCRQSARLIKKAIDKVNG